MLDGFVPRRRWISTGSGRPPRIHGSTGHLVTKELKSVSSSALCPLSRGTELFCIQRGDLLGKRSLWNWKLNVTVWELLFVLDFVPPLLFYSVSGSFCLSFFLFLSLFLLPFPFSFTIFCRPSLCLTHSNPPPYFILLIASFYSLSLTIPPFCSWSSQLFNH